MNIQKQGRRDKTSTEEARNTEHFRLRRLRRTHCHGEFYLSRRKADEVSWKHLSAEEQTQFSKRIATEWQGALDFKAVQASVIREKHSENGDLFSPCRFAGKRQTLGTRPRPNGACTVSRILTYTRLRRSCQTVVQHYTADPGVDYVRRDVDPTGKKAFMQGDPSVRDEPLYATSPHLKLPGVLVGAPIRLDRDVFGAGKWHVGMANTNCFPMKKKGLRDECI